MTAWVACLSDCGSRLKKSPKHLIAFKPHLSEGWVSHKEAQFWASCTAIWWMEHLHLHLLGHSLRWRVGQMGHYKVQGE